jgi:hypothetical protein
MGCGKTVGIVSPRRISRAGGAIAWASWCRLILPRCQLHGVIASEREAISGRRASVESGLLRSATRSSQ